MVVSSDDYSIRILALSGVPASPTPERGAASRTVRAGQFVLPLSSGSKISPGEVALVRSRPQIAGLLASRVLVADPQRWRISSLRTNPRIGGYLVDGGHPALSDPGPESLARLPRILPRISMSGGVELAVEYVGPEDSGECLVACLCAESDVESSRDLRHGSHGPVGRASPDSAARSFLAESPLVSRGERIQLPLSPRAHDLYVSGLTLRVADPTHWLVSDVLIGGDTLLVESGDLPGELLADRPGRAPLGLGRLRAKEDLVVQATYVGPLSSASLAYEVSGSEVPACDVAGNSAFLPMSSSARGDVLMHTRVGVPPGYAFLPEEIVLRDPERWAVKDVRVGCVSQFSQSGEVPGVLFGARTRKCRLSFDPVPGSDVDLSLSFRYLGPGLVGGPIACGAVGRVVRLPVNRPLEA